MAYTKAQLEALKNSILASAQPITAAQHRSMVQNIIDEMYDAQSRGNLLAGVQPDGIIVEGDTALVIRSGQAYLIPLSALIAENSGRIRVEPFNYSGSNVFELSESPLDIIYVSLNGQTLASDGIAWTLSGQDITIGYDLEADDFIQVCYSNKPLSLVGIGSAEAISIFDERLNIQKDQEGGIAANDTSILSIDSIEGISTTPRKNRTRLYIDDVDRGGMFSFEASGFTPNGGTVFEAEGGGYWVRQFAGSHNVKWYGVKGDLVTDEAPLVQSIIDSMPTETTGLYDPANIGKRNSLYFPPGTYIFKDSIQLNGNMELVSEGAKFVFRPLTSIDFIKINPDGWNWSATQKIKMNVLIRGISILGEYDPLTDTGEGEIGLNLENLAFSKIEDVRISGFRNNIKWGKLPGTVGMYYNAMEQVISRKSNLHLEFDQTAAFTVVGCSFSGTSGYKPLLRNLAKINAAGVSFLGCHFENTTDPTDTNFAHLDVVGGMVVVKGGYSEGATYFAEVDLSTYVSGAGRIELDPTNTTNGTIYYYNSTGLKDITPSSYARPALSNVGNFSAITKNANFQAGRNGLTVLSGLTAAYESLTTLSGKHSLRVEKVSDTNPQITFQSVFDSFGLINNVHFVVYNPDDHALTINLFDNVDSKNSGSLRKISQFDNGVQIYVKRLVESINVGPTITLQLGASVPIGAVINLISIHVSDTLNYMPIKQRSLKTYLDATPTEGAFLKGDLVYNPNPDEGEYSNWQCVTSGEFGTGTVPVLKRVGRVGGEKVDITGIAGKVPYFTSAEVMTSSIPFAYDAANQRLNIGDQVGLINGGPGISINGDTLARVKLTTTGTGIGLTDGFEIVLTGTAGFIVMREAFDLNLQTNATTRWAILGASGILQAPGAQTIQAATGNITIASAGGNGSVLLTPNGTGKVRVGGTIPNATGDFATYSGSGDLQKRTPAQSADDILKAISGYSAGVAQRLEHDSSGNLNWVNI